MAAHLADLTECLLMVDQRGDEYQVSRVFCPRLDCLIQALCGTDSESSLL
ncbi:MAG: hypothetical protein GWN76_23190 [candidate division Zixibacteria bacterium]|nr:hypothetical protein [candidate division Zixibacteria bacterium]NIU16828.1 hypothetical protein [candidate division Zixibacteria bacterium]